MIRLASATHSSQMYTRGPATNFATSASLFPQKEHASRFCPNISPPLVPAKPEEFMPPYGTERPANRKRTVAVEPSARFQGQTAPPPRSRKARAAVRYARTRGCAAPGCDMSWGKNSVATKNGWPDNSTILASPARSAPVILRGPFEK